MKTLIASALLVGASLCSAVASAQSNGREATPDPGLWMAPNGGQGTQSSLYAPMTAPTAQVYVAPRPPPDDLREVPTPRPTQGTPQWVGGYWGWDGTSYQWNHGQWVQPPSGRVTWAAPRWSQQGRSWVSGAAGAGAPCTSPRRRRRTGDTRSTLRAEASEAEAVDGFPPGTCAHRAGSVASHRGEGSPHGNCATGLVDPRRSRRHRAGPRVDPSHLARHLPSEVHLNASRSFAAERAAPVPRLDEIARGRMSVFEIQERGAFDPWILKRRALGASARTVRADIVQSHSYKPHLIAMFLRATHKVPWVGHHHGWTAENAKVKIYHRIDAMSLPRAERVVAVSESAREIVKSEARARRARGADPERGRPRGPSDGAHHGSRPASASTCPTIAWSHAPSAGSRTRRGRTCSSAPWGGSRRRCLRCWSRSSATDRTAARLEGARERARHRRDGALLSGTRRTSRRCTGPVTSW